MDVAQHREIAASFKSTRERTCLLEIYQSDVAIALEAEIEEVEILRDDGMCRSREV